MLNNSEAAILAKMFSEKVKSQGPEQPGWYPPKDWVKQSDRLDCVCENAPTQC